jgi:exopolysaccharide biosynthesis protein
MKVNFNSNTVVFYSESEKKFISISLNYRILGFCINENYVALLQDWNHIESSENLHIYNSKGNFLFNVKPSPKALYENGFYSSIGFESENILIAQSSDFRFKINLLTNEFIDESYTK